MEGWKGCQGVGCPLNVRRHLPPAKMLLRLACMCRWMHEAIQCSAESQRAQSDGHRADKMIFSRLAFVTVVFLAISAPSCASRCEADEFEVRCPHIRPSVLFYVLFDYVWQDDDGCKRA